MRGELWRGGIKEVAATHSLSGFFDENTIEWRERGRGRRRRRGSGGGGGRGGAEVARDEVEKKPNWVDRVSNGGARSVDGGEGGAGGGRGAAEGESWL